ncbi:MAG TPA: hypothetical protein VFX31_14495, partial [Ktedonobacterales bacterium]|nr:hypothetical protein [Ktedonobacterales bacterium]
RMLQLLDQIGRECIDVKVVPDLLQVIALKARLEDLDGIPIININDVPLQGFNSALKRSIDIGLSLAALLVLGAMDNISVVIRKTLLLLRTPDELRGRLSAVNNVFIGASNQLGGVESGALAAAIGPVGAVALGGIGSALAVAGIARAWPELRTLGRMTAIESDEANQTGAEAINADGQPHAAGQSGV